MSLIQLLLLTGFIITTKASTFFAGGPLFLKGILTSWWATYHELVPEVTFNFSHTQGNEVLLNSFATTAGDYNIGWIDPYSTISENAWDLSNCTLYPLLISTLAPILDLEADVVFSREVLADVFMGKITTWNDTSIRSLNPHLNLNETITVIYLVNGAANLFWSEALSSFSAEWNETYGTFSTWPENLRNLSNFVPVETMEQILPTLSLTPSSIAYFQPNPLYEIHYARLINKAGNVVGAENLEDSMHDVPLGDNFKTNYGIDASGDFAWPIGTYVHVVIPKNYDPSLCDEARELLIWLRWVYSTQLVRGLADASGLGFVTEDVRKSVLNSLYQTRCDDYLILGNALDEVRGNQLDALLSISVILFAFGLVLAGTHLWMFRQSKINLIYTSIFIVGIILTFVSPFYWYLEPETDSICQARVWTFSLGASLLLGTMFSRTWQLREIYLLQKKVFDLRRNISVRSSLIKLFVTLSIVITSNLLLLIVWSSTDPYRSHFVITDELNRIGDYGCFSDYQSVWLTTELIYMFLLIFFGVYVIYQTWSFQKHALVVETRWVLLALYNILLNIVALTPYFASDTPDLDFLNVLMMVSICFSGTGIICAVLLPRIVEKLEWTHSSDKDNKDTRKFSSHEEGKSNVKSYPKTGKDKEKMKQEISRTPEAMLVDRLTNPRPLKAEPRPNSKVPSTEASSTPDTLAPRSPSPAFESRVESVSVQLTPLNIGRAAVDPVPEGTEYTPLTLTSSSLDNSRHIDMSSSGESPKARTRTSMLWTANPIIQES